MNSIKDTEKVPLFITLVEIVKVLSHHFLHARILIAERYKFHKRDEKPTKSMSQFIMEHKNYGKISNFGDFLDNALRDRLVYRKLFIEPKLNFERTCTIIVLSMELAASQTKLLQPTTPETVNKLSPRPPTKNDDQRIGHQVYPSGYGRGQGCAKASEKAL
ncbi:hypothetical protein PR048_011887 [Dryococelus australis]|uniref:Uncharacterized protein n=1 Tax=Dryococelus australis TaxID=614101 RepID=A0ABQ9HMT2_9NEOP|nr:hypothetical protein PR048_011887 [Dryococelus australis]